MRKQIFRQLYVGFQYVMIAAVDGHVAEFGTASGRTARVLAKAMADLGHQYRLNDPAHGIGERKLFLFDSFEGLPQVSNPIDSASPHVSSGVWAPGVAKDVPADRLLEMCSQYISRDRITIVPGWYKDTLPRLDKGIRFAFVHIDCDLYESTFSVLDHLFQNDAFADGCALYFDDWYCDRGSAEYGEQRAWAECVKKYQPRFTDWGAYAAVGRRFIVHR